MYQEGIDLTAVLSSKTSHHAETATPMKKDGRRGGGVYMRWREPVNHFRGSCESKTAYNRKKLTLTT